MKTKIKNIRTIAVTLIVGILIGWLLFHGSSSSSEKDGHNHEQSAEKETIWTCSMHPQIQQHEPGSCPICAMDLVPLNEVDSGDEEVSPFDIQMTESAVKLADIQTLIVTKGTPEKDVLLSGKVQPDERNIASITSRINGRIESLAINFTGQKVYKGQSLGKIYSPELINAQKELLEAAKYKDDNPSFYNSAKSKLKLWNISEKQITSIETKGEPILYFDITAPISGTVSERNVSVGDYINEGSSLFKIIDLSKVWIMLNAYESDLPWINIGDKVSYELQSIPGEVFKGEVSFIDPFINAKTRIAQIRVEAKNSEDQFKPEMFVKGTIESNGAANTNEILIPKTAVLWTGKRAIVYIKNPDIKMSTFRYTEITLGPEAGSYYVVIDGISEGDEIAVNGVFKIDAAAQLSGLPSMMNPDGGRISMGHNHGEMEAGGNDNATHSNKEAETNEELDAPESFKEQLMETVNAYYNLKESFVKSDSKEVHEFTSKLEKELKKVDMSLLKGHSHMVWMDILGKIKKGIKIIHKSTEIEKQRKGFEMISDQLILSIESYGVSKGKEVYIEFCPMAFDDKGAFWMSSQKEIRNPYFGDMMLKCGEVTRTIKSN